MPEHWRRFREKLRTVPPVEDIDGSEIVPLVHKDMTRSIRLDQIVALGLDPGQVNLPPAAPPVPPGTVTATLSDIAPGWLECDGRAVSRTQFARLFGVIGETFGPGDGTATFNLPTIRTALTTGKGPGVRWMVAL